MNKLILTLMMTVTVCSAGALNKKSKNTETEQKSFFSIWPSSDSKDNKNKPKMRKSRRSAKSLKSEIDNSRTKLKDLREKRKKLALEKKATGGLDAQILRVQKKHDSASSELNNLGK